MRFGEAPGADSLLQRLPLLLRFSFQQLTTRSETELQLEFRGGL